MLVKNYLKEIPLCEANFSRGKHKENDQFVFCKLDTSEAFGEILVVEFYTMKRELDRRFFTDGKNWTTLEDGKWSPKTLDGGYYYNSPEYIESEQSRLISKEFFAKHNCRDYRGDTASLITSFIYSKNSEKRQQYADNKYRRMMDQIDSIPKPPEGIAQYCNEYVFANRYIVFLKEKKGKKTQCRCLHCEKDFMVDVRPKHRDRMICPECGSETKVIAERYISSLKDKTKLLILYKVDGFVQKVWSNVLRRYSTTSFNASYDFDPYYYEIETEKAVNCYHYVTSWWTAGFTKTKYLCSDKAFVYAGNMKEIFEGGWFLDMNLERLRFAGMISFSNLISNAMNGKTAAKLYKIGLYNMATDYCSRLRGETFEEALGVSKNYLPILKKYNASVSELEAIKMSDAFVNEEMFGKLINLMRKGNSYGLQEEMKKVLKLMTFIKMINYFTKQSEYMPKKDLGFWLGLYSDYIQMLKQLNANLPRKKRIDINNLNIRYPKDLKVAHDRVSEQLKIRSSQTKEKDLKRIAKELEKTHSFTYKSLMIIFPQGSEDFINEGSKLSHCVGSSKTYMDTHIKGTWRVLFIRKKKDPDTPYYTLTVYTEGNVVKECQGKCHANMTAEVKQFVERYCQFLNKSKKQIESKVA